MTVSVIDLDLANKNAQQSAEMIGQACGEMMTMSFHLNHAAQHIFLTQDQDTVDPEFPQMMSELIAFGLRGFEKVHNSLTLHSVDLEIAQDAADRAEKAERALQPRPKFDF